MPCAHAEIGPVEWLCVVESVAVFRIFILPVKVFFRDPARAVKKGRVCLKTTCFHRLSLRHLHSLVKDRLFSLKAASELGWVALGGALKSQAGVCGPSKGVIEAGVSLCDTRGAIFARGSWLLLIKLGLIFPEVTILREKTVINQGLGITNKIIGRIRYKKQRDKR